MEAISFLPPIGRADWLLRRASSFRFTSRPWAVAALAVLLSMLAMVRPIDHDESQYVAAAMLSAKGLLPYRDYAYLQTPLQPLLFAPAAWLLGDLAYPGLRLINALLGAAAIVFVYLAARASSASERNAMTVAGLFATTDILLFSIGVARNDALPVAMLAAALWLILKDGGGERSARSALLVGMLLAGAAAAKASYALPAAAYGIWTLIDREHRPAWVAAGAAVPCLFVAWFASLDPQAFVFEVFHFPALAPQQYYGASDRAFKLELGFRLLDIVKFVALGAALPALAVVASKRWRIAASAPDARLLDVMIVAGLVSAVLPEPTWRQYLLPMLPPLFVQLARLWHRDPPERRLRIVFALFAIAGTVPTLLSLAAAREGVPMARVIREGQAIDRILDAAGVQGPVATLSPQLLAAANRTPDPRFAAGPFYFRSRKLLSAAEEAAFGLVSRDMLSARSLTDAVLLGGEAQWSGGDQREEDALAAAARRRGAREVQIEGGRLRLLLLPGRQAAARAPFASKPS